MAEYISEDEELEKFKRWWKESGQQLLLMVAIAASGYFGWQFWQDKQQQQAEAGYLVYQQLLDLVQSEQSEPLGAEQQALVTHLSVTLKDDFSGSQYAYYGSLMLAGQAARAGDLELATTELTQVMDSADEGLSLMARLRLARLEAQRQGPDAALALLAVVDPKTYAASYAEAQGDFYLLKGDHAAAREAYQASLLKLRSEEQQYQGVLETKLNQVAQVDLTAAAEAATEEKAE